MRQIPVGVVIADVDRVENTDYYNCLTSTTSTNSELADLERAEWMGLNAYQHCDGSVTDSDNAAGYQNFKLDFDDYSIPLLLTEYGCLNESFEDQNGFQSQRTFDDARWIFEEDFRDTLAGGFVFEYSVERQNSLVPFPFQEFGAGNFGIGYFATEFCTDNPEIEDEWCRYLKKPEFTNLQEAYAATTHVGVENRDTFSPPASRQGASTCPEGWPSISDYTWASDAEPDLWCTDAVTFQCVNVQIPDDVDTTNTTTTATVPPLIGPTNATQAGNGSPTAAPGPTSDVPSSVPTITAEPTAVSFPPTTLPTSDNLDGAGNETGSGGSKSIRLKNFRVTLSGEKPNEVALKNTMLTYLSDEYTKTFEGFLFMRLDVLQTSRKTRRRTNAVVVAVRQHQQEQQLLVIENNNSNHRRQEEERDLQIILFEVDFFGTAFFKDDDKVPTNAQVEQQQTISLSNRTGIEEAMANNPEIDNDIVLERVEWIEGQTSRAPTPAPPPSTTSGAAAAAATTRGTMTVLLSSLVTTCSLILFTCNYI